MSGGKVTYVICSTMKFFLKGIKKIPHKELNINTTMSANLSNDKIINLLS